MAEAAPDTAREPEPELAADSLARGTRLGRYELLVPVAIGGMARVWAARLHGQRGFTKLVAIKTVLPHLASDPEFERMLADEARIASGTRHPNVAEIHELGEDNGVLYIVLEWVYGDSLAHILRANGTQVALEPRVAARIVADAAAGLHAAHNLCDENGRPLEVVHRDVSPQNLLVAIDGNVKVTDFGVAKAIGASHSPTAAGHLKGKIAYMAPEQATGGAVDRRSDVFSLGCVLYEATTGTQPFRGEGDHQVMQEVVRGSFMAPSRVVRGYPYDLERIVVRALAAQPLHRYPTADHLRTALEEWIAKSGSVVTQSHVGQAVAERIGTTVERRRERIRVATQALTDGRSVSEGTQLTPSLGHAVSTSKGGTPSGVVERGTANRDATPSHASIPSPPPASGAAFPPVIEIPPRTPTGVQYVAAAALGVLAAAALGVGSVWVWKALQPPAPPVAQVVAAPAAVPAAPLPKAAPAPPATGTPQVAEPPIAFRVVPDQAFLVVDGVALAPSVRSLPRPASGVTEHVVVRASGFEDQALTIDATAATSVDVWLTPVPAATPKRAAAPSHPHADEPAAHGPPEPLPANPY